LENYKTFEEPVQVALADDSTVLAYGKGDVHILLECNGSFVDVKLLNVTHAPRLKKNLFSIPVAKRRGVIRFEGDDVYLKAGEANFRLGYFGKGLFQLDYRIPAKCKTECPSARKDMQAMQVTIENGESAEIPRLSCGDILHHAVTDDVKQVSKLFLDGSESSEKFSCEDSVIGNASRTPFSDSVEPAGASGVDGLAAEHCDERIPTSGSDTAEDTDMQGLMTETSRGGDPVVAETDCEDKAGHCGNQRREMITISWETGDHADGVILLSDSNDEAGGVGGYFHKFSFALAAVPRECWMRLNKFVDKLVSSSGSVVLW
jgi:hypothetical protein